MQSHSGTGASSYWLAALLIQVVQSFPGPRLEPSQRSSTGVKVTKVQTNLSSYSIVDIIRVEEM